ncbi:gas vesicle protein [Actinoplanes sp. TBRC 11911]|uniref:gas vesicle protein n=1 Tax=Actinoplanes sp. TBRC 11911 TaxID=2729386 RepID=UPI00145DD2EA|nr:gas vesicle protein [Actinoplanes sp. TBRC 11911]NMO50729.1 gas vesicle protein [Actinoplanes sp. TBRC 11911]
MTDLLYQPVPLVDLLDRVLATGVVITGDVTISIAEVDLVRISLRALVASVGALAEDGEGFDVFGSASLG